MRARLTITGGSDVGKEFVIRAGQTFVLGRGKEVVGLALELKHGPDRTAVPGIDVKEGPQCAAPLGDRTQMRQRVRGLGKCGALGAVGVDITAIIAIDGAGHLMLSPLDMPENFFDPMLLLERVKALTATIAGEIPETVRGEKR